MFVSGRHGAVLPSFKTRRPLMPAAARQPPAGPGSNCRQPFDFMLATLVCKGAAWSVATLPAIGAPANPPTNAILRVRMFASVSCWEIPQARTAALAELGPLGVIRYRNAMSAPPKFDFRSSPKSGLKSDIGPCPFRANSGRHQVRASMHAKPQASRRSFKLEQDRQTRERL
jgi:hypothetical protein